MKKSILITIIILWSAVGNAQLIKLNKDINVDTLRVWIDYSEQIETELTRKIQQSAIVAMQRFNNDSIGFVAVLDSTPADYWMRMEMGDIKYIDTKANLIWTGVGIATLAGHVYALSALGWTLPILLIPSTFSKVHFETSKGLLSNKPKRNKIYINPMGYLRKIEKQKEKVVSKTEKVLYEFLKKLGKQDEKNNRH